MTKIRIVAVLLAAVIFTGIAPAALAADGGSAKVKMLETTEHRAYILGRSSSRMYPNAQVSRAEVATIFYRLLTTEAHDMHFSDLNDFSDVNESHWANRAISTLADMGIVNGRKPGRFEPDECMTRAEFITLAIRFYDGDVRTVETPFRDVVGHWAEKNIAFAYSLGWVNGEDGTFKPERNITRAEVIKTVNTMLDRKVDYDGVISLDSNWEDVSITSWYYYEIVEASTSHTYERREEDSPVENWTAVTD